MHFLISENLVKCDNKTFAAMVALVNSYKVIKEKLKSNTIIDLLNKEHFTEVVPETDLTLNDLISSMSIYDTAYVELHDTCVGILNKLYYATENLDDQYVKKYYISHDKGHNIKYRCTICGNCCKGDGAAIVTVDEVKKIMEHTHGKLKDIANSMSLSPDKTLYSLKSSCHRCKFLNLDNKCQLINCLPYNCNMTNLSYLFMGYFGGPYAFFNCNGIGVEDGNIYSIDDILKELEEYKQRYGEHPELLKFFKI